MNRRDEQIAAIMAGTADLSQARLQSFYEQVRESYGQSSIVERVAIVEEIDDRSPSDFRVLANEELRRVDQFNAENVFWGTYCKDLGRSVALGEKAYLFETLRERVPDTDVHPGGRFRAILDVVDELQAQGRKPNVILAPIAHMVGFWSEMSAEMVWDEQGRSYLHTTYGRLKVFTSSRGIPLDRFIVFSHTAGRWLVKRDPWVGGRLTVAIGEQFTPAYGVIWLAQTIAKYKITDIEGFRSFRPDVQPDPDFASVR